MFKGVTLMSMPDARQGNGQPQDEEFVAELTKVIDEGLRPYLGLYQEGMARAETLLGLATACDASSRDEILRAVVVLTHAYLEDFLRTVAQIYLPLAGEKVLDDVPLAGLSKTGRTEKFTLGKLMRHKGKAVDDVIRESISEFLERSTFNSTTEIAALLEQLGFNAADHNQKFPGISAMIERRHLVVHRADRAKVDDKGNSVLRPISAHEVHLWVNATSAFITGMISMISARKVVKFLETNRPLRKKT
jgi:hypothetical protein